MPTLTTGQWSQLLTKALRESDFRQKLSQHAQPAAQELGIELSDTDVRKLKAMLHDLQRMNPPTLLTDAEKQKLLEDILRKAHVGHHSGADAGPGE